MSHRVNDALAFVLRQQLDDRLDVDTSRRKQCLAEGLVGVAQGIIQRGAADLQNLADQGIAV